jgi:hypothetical protein
LEIAVDMIALLSSRFLFYFIDWYELCPLTNYTLARVPAFGIRAIVGIRANFALPRPSFD